MSPWTALLESLHSALIDELTERHPEPKPELGMPIRQKQFALPAEGLASALACEASFVLEGGGEARGFIAIAADPAFIRKASLEAEGLWKAVLKRAGGEFLHRGIKPRLGEVKTLALSATSDLPQGFAVPGRVVWVPFRLSPGSCYLAVGT